MIKHEKPNILESNKNNKKKQETKNISKPKYWQRQHCTPNTEKTS